MFDPSDYYYKDNNDKIPFGINKEKVEYDTEQFKKSLRNLYEIMGPYTIKVTKKKTKIKGKKNKKGKSNG